MCFVDLLDWHVAIDEFYFILRRGSFFTQSRFHKKRSIKSIMDLRQDKKNSIFLWSKVNCLVKKNMCGCFKGLIGRSEDPTDI